MTNKMRTTLTLSCAGALVAGSLLLSRANADRAGANEPGLLHPGGGGASAAPATKPVPTPAKKSGRTIQMAILLDTSSSMDGLIDQARTQLWKVVNEMARATVNGERPSLQIALYEYGNQNLSVETGFVRQVLPFTESLDTVSEALFSLTTDGGDEYAGRVIKSTLDQLMWSEHTADPKLIFIAGNEEFDQGEVSYRASIASASAKGIIVNTIYCGAAEEAESAGWRAGATVAGGAFLSIDQDRKVAHIRAPQDDDIARLGSQLNDTYIAYGYRGAESAHRQLAQDSNAASNEGSMIDRSVSKANGLYRNSEWDLVDALGDGTVDLAKLKTAELPEEMTGMTATEQTAHIKAQAEKRVRLQEEISELARARAAFVAKKQAEVSADGSLSFDMALLSAVRAQGTKAGLSF